MKKGVLILLLISSLTTLILLVIEDHSYLGIPLIIFFSSLSGWLKIKTSLKGFSFTPLIFAAVSAALFYPHLFTEIQGFDLKKLIVPLLIIIMFGMGTSMSFQDFVGVIKMPKAVLVGILCQFTIMPIVGFALAYFSKLPPEIAAGIILVGCSPSGLASNVMSYISGANLALSLTLTAIATLLAPIMTPLLMKMLAGQLIPIDGASMFLSIVKIVIAPILAGLLFNKLAHGRFKWLDRMMPSLSMMAITMIITIITAAGRDSLLSIGLILILVVTIHNLVGYLLGYSACRVIGMDIKSCRTIAFEVGMQNSGLASGIALEMGRVATMGLAPAVFGPFMNITGSSLAAWWKSKTEKKKN